MVYIDAHYLARHNTKNDVVHCLGNKLPLLLRMIHNQGSSHVATHTCLKKKCKQHCYTRRFAKIKGVPEGEIMTALNTTFSLELISEWSHKGNRVMFMKQCGCNKFFIVSKHSATFRQALSYYDIVCHNDLVRWRRFRGRVHSYMAQVADKVLQSTAFRKFQRQIPRHGEVRILCFGFSFGGALSKLLSIPITAAIPNAKVLMISEGGFPISDEAFLRENVETNPRLYWLNMIHLFKGTPDNVAILFTPPYTNPPSVSYGLQDIDPDQIRPSISIPCNWGHILNPLYIYRQFKRVLGGKHIPLSYASPPHETYYRPCVERLI